MVVVPNTPTFTLTRLSDKDIIFQYSDYMEPLIHAMVLTIVTDEDISKTTFEAHPEATVDDNIQVMTSTMLSSTASLLVYSRMSDGSLIARSVDVVDPDFSLSFGTPLVVGKAQSMTSWVDLDVSMLSDMGNFAILYTDALNDNSLTMAFGQYTKSERSYLTTSNIVLGEGNSGNVYTWGALAQSEHGFYNSRVALLSIATEKSCTVDTTV